MNICERVIELNTEPPLKPYVDLPRMAETVQAMVRDALDAFVQADPERAREVIDRDRVVDAYYGQIFRELLTYMMEDPRNIYRAMRVQSIAKYLERIGDHATNLAEMVIFMVVGKDVRHLGSMASRRAGACRAAYFSSACTTRRAARWPKAGRASSFPPGVSVCSAGSEPAREVNPYAVRVMQEIGIDISDQRPKLVSDVPLGDIDTVITLCAEEGCALPPGGLVQHHWGYEDPSVLTGTDEEIMAEFRRTRDSIKGRLEDLLAQSS